MPSGSPASPLRRALYGLAPAVALGAGLLGLGEWSQRQAEARDGLVIPWDAPALKYEFAAGGMQNSHGFNEREVAIERVPGVVRIAALGDSITHGAFVPSAQAWPRALEDALVARDLAAQVLNFGVYGYDTESVAAQLDQRVLAWRPDLVIYGFYANDPLPTELVTADGRPLWVGTGARDFRVLSVRIDALLHRGSALFRRFEGAAAARAVAARPRQGALDWDGCARALDSLVATATSIGVPLVLLLIPPHVVSQPDLPACDASAAMGPQFCSSNLDVLNRAEALARARDLPIVDGVAAYRAAPFVDLHGLPTDPHHPSAEGHRRLANALVPVVADHFAAAPGEEGPP